MERGNGSGLQVLQSPFSATDGVSSSKRMGLPLPPSHPNSPQIMASRPAPQNLNHRGPSHSRSLSQSSMPSLDFLPPLSPQPFPSPISNRNDGVLTDVSMEDAIHSSGNTLRVSEGLPPRKRGHRRSSSDSIPLGFSAMIQSSPQLIPIGSFDRPVSGGEKQGDATKGESKSEGDAVGDDLLNSYMNLDIVDTLNSSGVEDSRTSGTKTNGNDGSDNEVESRVKGKGIGLVEMKEGLKRSATADIAPASRHYRSMSMDSYMGSLGNLQFDDDFLMQPMVGAQAGQHSPSNSMDGNFNKMKLEFGNGEFSEVELKKIAANEKLSEIALSDPKRAKRILANRLSAARSKERKLRYISELEQKVQTLQTEATTLSAQVTVLQRDAASLTTQNNELKFRLQAMEQQAQLKEALNEALVAEVQRLRITAAELNGISHQRPSGNSEMNFSCRTPAAHAGQHLQRQQKELQQPAQRNHLYVDATKKL